MIVFAAKVSVKKSGGRRIGGRRGGFGRHVARADSGDNACADRVGRN